MALGFYTGLIIIADLIDLYLIILLVKHKYPNWNYLMRLIINMMVVCTTYLCSTHATSYFVMSLFSSMHFVSIDFMLAALLRYCQRFTGSYQRMEKVKHHPSWLLNVFIAFDAIVLLINPFKEIAITYNYVEDAAMHYEYVPKLLYNFHLGISYALVAFVLFVLITKILMTPRVFRMRYGIILIGIFLVVVVNALFLFVQKSDLLDYSLTIYTVVGIFIYIANYSYSEKTVVNAAREMAVDNLGHPVVLFDYEDKYALSNADADFLIPRERKNIYYSYEKFVDAYGFAKYIVNPDIDISFQWNDIKREGNSGKSYRCDYKVLKDKKGKILAKLFVFTDNSIEIDLLTGYHTEAHFKNKYAYDNLAEMNLKYPVAVAVFDINRLTAINSKYGKKEGDKAIKYLADSIKESCPKGTYRARLHDAHLMILCQDCNLSDVRKIVDKVKEKVALYSELEEKLDIQSAVNVTMETGKSLIKSVDVAEESMRVRKMMDRSSAHSSLLDSLAQTLQESDSCTEEHVKRTNIMGEKLGRRLGLSDIDLSNLALLCLLHDIGKLGIPLEILNKPGKLSNDEWKVMRSHAEKGYRIAMAAKELQDIAELILHHHECWDGSGYPDRLSKEEIPLLSRIISVVDTYDAMTNDRPYRKALSASEACAELRRCAGTQFDPFIVSEFIEMLKENDLVDEDNKDEVNETKNIIKPMGLKDEKKELSGKIAYLEYTTYTLDENEKIIEVDDSFEEISGYTRDDLATYNLGQADLIPADEREEYFGLVAEAITKYHEAFIEHKLVRKDGSTKYVFCHGRQFFDSVTRKPRVKIIATDIANSVAIQEMVAIERDSARRSFDRWEDSIRHDPLTGVLNRIAFQNDLQMKLMADDMLVVMLMMDIDLFKIFNDTKGHWRGDELLKLFARALKSEVAEYGIVGRMGGDEFGAMMCFDKGTKREIVETKVTDVWKNISDSLRSFDDEVTISMGAVLCQENKKTFNDLYKKTDETLYKAKEEGRDRVVFDELS